MNAELELRHAYQEWHRLARAETRAIQTRHWDFLADCQQATQDLQPIVSRLTQQARGEWAEAGGDLTAKEQQLQACRTQFISIRQQNQILLQATQNTARENLDELRAAGRNLKRLQHSYGGQRVAAA